MHLTRESEYALLALGFLAGAEPGTPVSVAEIAAARGLPVQFLSKIFQKLGRAGLVAGGRGRGRGYELAVPATQIRVGQVLAAVESPDNLDTCLLWQGYCGDANPCPLHHRMKDMHARLRRMVHEVTLVDYMETAGHVKTRADAVHRTDEGPAAANC